MKKFKQIISVLFAVLTLGMCFNLSAFADEFSPSTQPNNGEIIIKNNPDKTNVFINGKKYLGYRLLDLHQDQSTDSSREGYAYTLNKLSNTYFTSDTFTAKYGTTAVNVQKPSTVYDFIKALTTAQGIEAFANNFYDFITTSDFDATGFKVEATASNEEAKFENLYLGYYVMFGTSSAHDGDTEIPADEVLTAVMLDTTTYDEDASKYTLTIEPKIGAPTIDKNIVTADKNGNEKLVKGDDANIGDVVKFRVESRVPNVIGYTAYDFWMSDTMSKGLTLVDMNSEKPYNAVDKLNEAFTVTFEKADGKRTVIDPEEYDVVAFDGDDGAKVYKLYFKNFYDLVGIDNANYAANTKIFFDYSARLNSDAKIAPTANPNEAVINYSNNPHDNQNGKRTPGTPENPQTPPPGETVKPKVYVYTFEYDVNKFDSNTTTKKLANAEFQLYKGTYDDVTINPAKDDKGYNKVTVVGAEETDAVQFILQDDGVYRVATQEEIDVNIVRDEATGKQLYNDGYAVYKAGSKMTNRVKSDANGKINMIGLDGGLYQATTDSEGNVVWSDTREASPYTLVEVQAPDGYNLLDKPINVKIGAEYDADGKLTELAAKADGESYDLIANAEDVATLAGIKTDVGNSTGTELPSTGGMGTTIIYLVGGFVILASIIAIMVRTVAKKKKEI